MELTQHEKLYLLNYYIETGSFSNLSKNNSKLYKKLLAEKKEQPEFESNTLAEYLEMKLIPNKKHIELSSSYIRMLKEHYTEYSSLVDAPISKSLEKQLIRNADKLGISVEELKKKFDTSSIYPEVMEVILNPINIRDYNSLMGIIGINLFMDMNEKPNIGREIFEQFEDANHLRQYEPAYYTFLESRIPKYAGPIENNVDNIKFIVEGTKYYGENIYLDSVQTLINDLFFIIKGHISNKNLPSSVFFKLIKMIEEQGNLNWIGFDNMNLLSELDNIVFSLGFNSIAELLRDEGFTFNPVTSDKVNIIPRFEDYEVLIDGFETGLITIDATVKKYLEDMNLVQTLQVVSGDYKGNPLHVLVYEYEGKNRFVHELVTRSKALTFKDRNSLTVTVANLIGG